MGLTREREQALESGDRLEEEEEDREEEGEEEKRGSPGQETSLSV